MENKYFVNVLTLFLGSREAILFEVVRFAPTHAPA